MFTGIRKALEVMVCVAICASSAQAVFFDLRDTGAVEDLDGGITLDYPVGGITATLTAVVGPPAGGGVFNVTSNGFGVNATGTGDDTDNIDGDLGIEEVHITFDQDVWFNELTVSSFGSSDEGAIIIAGGSPISITSTGLQDVVDTQVLFGESVIVKHVAGNGFSFDSFVATPEPSAILLLGLGSLAIVRRRRR